MTPSRYDSVEQFAADLRELRKAAGDPILEALASRSGRGRTVLSDAFRGTTLPTRGTLIAIVKSLDGDEDAWVKRWTRLRLAASGSPLDDELDDQPPQTLRPRNNWWLTTLIGLLCLAVGFGVGIAMRRPAPATPPSPSAQPTADATSGTDPWTESACQPDVVPAKSGTRADHYLVELFWSETCQAAWGQVTRFDGSYTGNTLTVTVFREHEQMIQQSITKPDSQAVHTPMLVDPGRPEAICVTGSAQVGTAEVDLGPPLCMSAKS